jgi:uncharacterized protein (DUF4415 family)
MSTKRKITIPTEAEDAAITAAALSDPDAQPLTDDELAQFTPARKRGRPAKANPKVAVNLRLDEAVVNAFKATGDGWQTRINAALVKHLADG